MKHILLALTLGLASVAYAGDKPKEEKVCIKTTDAKTKKETEKCRVVKKHDKLEKVTPTK